MLPGEVDVLVPVRGILVEFIVAAQGLVEPFVPELEGPSLLRADGEAVAPRAVEEIGGAARGEDAFSRALKRGESGKIAQMRNLPPAVSKREVVL